MSRRVLSLLAACILACALALPGCGATQDQEPQQSYDSSAATTYEAAPTEEEGAAEAEPAEQPSSDAQEIPSKATVTDDPSFTNADITYAKRHLGYESYSKLDYLGRCGKATACLGPETMPAKGEKRGSIGMVKPSGWHTVKYDNVDGKYLYNRCHLIGWQLSSENANERNLVTGTRWMNTEGMLPYENEVADYIDRTGNHVLYRATPLFKGKELVCRGVRIEALSIEDNGRGVSFNAYCPNTQPDISINYATGRSELKAGAGKQSGAFESSATKSSA